MQDRPSIGLSVDGRRDGRVVDCGGLENHCTERYRGFESLSLRQPLLAMQWKVEGCRDEALVGLGFSRSTKKATARPGGWQIERSRVCLIRFA